MLRLALALLLTTAITSCGSGGSGSSEGTQVYPAGAGGTGTVGRALLGPVVGAEVNVYAVGTTTPICSTTTQNSNSYENAGRFVISPECLAGSGPFIVVVKGGQDIDPNDDGIIDVAPVPVLGEFHAILTHEIASAGNWNVSAATEAAYQYVRFILSEHLTEDEVTSRLDGMAFLFLRNGISNGKEAKYQDLVEWNPRHHQALLRDATAVAQLEDAIRKGNDTSFSGSSAPLTIGQYLPSGEIQAVTTAGDLALSGRGDLAFAVEADAKNTNAGIFRVLKIKPEVSVLGSLNITGPTLKAVVNGGRIYLAKGAKGIQVISIGKPPTSVWEGNVGNTNTVDIAFYGNTVLLASGAQGVVIAATHQSDGSLVERSRLVLPNTAAAMTLEIANNKAYIAAEGNGVFVIDLTNLDNLSVLNHYQTTYPVRDISVAGGHLFMLTPGETPDVSTLRALSLNSESDTPPVASELSILGGEVNRLSMNGSIAYIANGTYGVSLIDVSNPAKPQHLVSYYLMEPVRDIIAINDVLLLAGKSVNGPNELSVIAGLSALPP